MKLTQIQKALKAPKNQFNAFGKYAYRNCEDILEALKPLMDGCSLTITDEVVMIGNRFYIKATARFNDNGNLTEVTAYAREEESKKGMDGAQVTGAASSYARKYALNGLFLIDDTKDADSTNKHNKEKDDVPDFIPPPEENVTQTNVASQDAKPALISEAQRKRFYAIAKGSGKSDAEIKAFLQSNIGSESTCDIKKGVYEYLCDAVVKVDAT